jgi:thioredoxin 1
LIEIEPNELPMQIKGKTSAVFFHTPLCGTCKVGRRMLEIVEATIPNMKIASCNINTASEIASTYNIESVPCLIVFSEGTVKEKVYAFQSVDYLYNLLRSE